MRKRNLPIVVIMLMAVWLFTPAFLREAPAKSAVQVDARLVRRIRHELATLPYYGVFDWLQFEVRPDNTVVLRGQVVRPSTKADAGARVKDIDGVRGVINEIEVLPLSPQDDRLRIALYRPYMAGIRRCFITRLSPYHRFTSSWTVDARR